MSESREEDWDPRSEAVLRDQRAAYDEMRQRCPVAYSDYLEWSLFRHEDIVRVLDDPATFSNAASRHLSVPNGMDPPKHSAYRHAIEPYFAPTRMRAFEPTCRRIAAGLTRSLLGRSGVDFVAAFAQVFALRVQCAFLGWPADLHEPLRLWTKKNQQATLAQDREAMADIAQEFVNYVGELLRVRRASAAESADDITTSLMRVEVHGRPLRDEEIVSILRNWTVGEVGTIAAAIGILVHFIAQDADLQQQLRDNPSLLPAAIDEILRLHGPLVANRRVTTHAVEIGNRRIEAGERLSLIWMSANRDERAFADADKFRLDRDQRKNLLYGAGIHVCPGAPLANLEMRVVMEELLVRTTKIDLSPDRAPVKAVYPASGFATLHLHLR